MPELNPQQFFHGTSAALEPGDRLQPAAELGMAHSPHRDMYDRPEHAWRRSKVFMSQDENHAWGWAQHSASLTGRQPAVYEVSPSSDVEGHRHGAPEHFASSATVKRRIDIPPPTDGPRQGQLFGAERWDSYEDKSR